MNIRVRFTIKTIEEALLSLLNDKAIDQIRVTEICQLAEINRTTFYKYFDNPYDLLNKLEARMLDELQEQLLLREDPSLTDTFRLILEDILRKKNYYIPLFSYNGDKMFRKRLFDFCFESNMPTIEGLFPELSKRQQEWIYYFIAEGCNGILKRWLAGGMRETPEEVVVFLDQMVNSVNQTKFVF